MMWSKLIPFLACLQVAVCLQWTSNTTLPDNFTIPICEHQDVTLDWDYVTDPSEQIVNIEWRFRPTHGSREEVLATAVNGHFFADPSVHQRLEYIPGAGIRLFDAVEAYSGTYSVHVNLNVQGSIQTLVQSVLLTVTNENVTTTPLLQAQQTGARFMTSDSQHHIILTCGNFNPLWVPAVEVVWTTPQNQTLPSTFRENNQYALAVPNPFLAGDYSCHIDQNAPATLCIAGDSPLRGGANVTLDATLAGITLTTSELQYMQQQILQLNGQLQALQGNNTYLQEQFHVLQAQHTNYTTELQLLNTQHQNLTSTLAQLNHG